MSEPHKISQINNRLIARNTALLYVRTLVVMLISLYTSRVILKTLGVEDYGVYNVIGGLVGMFSVISNAISSAISRFITYEIGSGDLDKLKKIFSTSIIIQILISIVFFIIAELVGGWFLHSKMQIPEGRLWAAEWVLHISLLTFCINLINVPYNACLIAHEHMKAFAYVSVVDAVMKLVISYLIVVSPVDRLVSYVVLLLILSIGIRHIYVGYCRRHFEESKVHFVLDKDIFKQLFGFAGWNFFTNTASVFNNQGVNMLINVFFGVTVNAARGIALQVENSVMNFVNSFTTAINPQITKSYAAGELEAMYQLVCRGAKFSYLAMLFFSLPIIFEADIILDIWLVEVPDYAVTFVRLSLVLGLLDCLGKSCYNACIATGKMKLYAIIYTPVAILEFPLTWIAFAMGGDVVWAYYLYILVKTLCLSVRLVLIKVLLGFKPMVFVKSVYGRIIPATLVAVVTMFLVTVFVPSGYLRLLLSIVVGVCVVAISSLYIAMTKKEREVILSKVMTAMSKIRK